MSSAQVVGVVRRLLGGAKIGHAGTLDPEASGVLPLMVGKAARLFDYMQDKEKAYVTEVAFGASTDTQDAQGTVVETGTQYPDEAAARAMLPRFTGTIWQTPPMYSAIKQDGKRLYQLARDGKQADIPAREVTVHALEWRGAADNHGALLAVRCSKGFYVRTLCQDLGDALGCPAHMRFLLRTQSGPFTLDTARTLEQLAKASEEGTLSQLILPPETALGHLPMTTVPRKLEKPVRNGGKLDWERFPALHDTPAADGTPFGLWMNGELCAIGQRQEDSVKIRTWLGE
jgi:tRNA pseudouridine55 synthase